MFVKQIDMKLALELAAKGKEVLVMAPTTTDPKKWTDYETDTLGHMLDNCLFFRQEPAMEPDRADEDKDPSEDPQEEVPPPTGKRRGAKRAVYAYLQRMRKENQDGEVDGKASERD